mgnify:CR=1 FL=1
MTNHRQWYRPIIFRILSNAKRILIIIVLTSMLTSWLLYCWVYSNPLDVTTESSSDLDHRNNYYYFQYSSYNNNRTSPFSFDGYDNDSFVFDTNSSLSNTNPILRTGRLVTYNNRIQKSIINIENDSYNSTVAIQNWITKCQPYIARYFDVCQKTEQSISDDDGDDSKTAELNTHVQLPDYSDHSLPISEYNSNKQIINLSISIHTDGLSDRLYLYQAYERFEQNDKYSVVIISIVNRSIYCPDDDNDQLQQNDENQLYCQLQINGNVILSKANLQCLPEHHNYLYTAAVIKCFPSSSFISSFDFVRIRENLEQSKWLPIHNRQKYSNKSIQSVVCVRPLFGSINVLNLFEFIEFYHNQGFDRIIFYHYANGNFTGKAKRLLFYLNETMSNIVQMKSIPLPRFIWKQIHSGGQLVTINDCLNQYPNAIQLHVDIDEFVSLSNGESERNSNMTIMQMIRKYWYESKTSYIALYIANVLHCHEFNLAHSNYYEFTAARQKYPFGSIKNDDQCYDNDQTNQNGHKNLILAQLLDNHVTNMTIEEMKSLLLVPNSIFFQATLWPYQLRSKVIILRPWLIDLMGIHHVWKFRHDYDIIGNSFVDQLSYMLRSKWTIDDKQILFTFKNIDKNQLLLRHFRWCCHLKQPYWLQLFQFDSLDDQVIRWKQKNLADWSKIGHKVFQHYNQFRFNHKIP